MQTPPDMTTIVWTGTLCHFAIDSESGHATQSPGWRAVTRLIKILFVSITRQSHLAFADVTDKPKSNHILICLIPRPIVSAPHHCKQGPGAF